MAASKPGLSWLPNLEQQGRRIPEQLPRSVLLWFYGVILVCLSLLHHLNQCPPVGSCQHMGTRRVPHGTLRALASAEIRIDYTLSTHGTKPAVEKSVFARRGIGFWEENCRLEPASARSCERLLGISAFCRSFVG